MFQGTNGLYTLTSDAFMFLFVSVVQKSLPNYSVNWLKYLYMFNMILGAICIIMYAYESTQLNNSVASSFMTAAASMSSTAGAISLAVVKTTRSFPQIFQISSRIFSLLDCASWLTHLPYSLKALPTLKYRPVAE